LSVYLVEQGWGDLQADLTRATALLNAVGEKACVLDEARANLQKAVQILNVSRRDRVWRLLSESNLLICLLHGQVFPEEDFDKRIVPATDTTIIRMVASWRVTHREYDSDPSYTDESRQYDTVACSLCRQVVSRGNFREGRNTHTMMNPSKPTATTPADLYTDPVIDEVSERYLGMPQVDERYLKSL
jgi:hypothetical protein